MKPADGAESEVLHVGEAKKVIWRDGGQAKERDEKGGGQRNALEKQIPKC